MTTRPTPRHWLMFLLLSLAWGSSYLFIKIGIETLSPFTLIAWRLLFGVIGLSVVFRLSGASLPRDRRTYGHLVVLAFLNIALPFSLITWGERYIDSNLAAILQATMPLFTIVFAALALDDEAITPGRILGLGLGFTGVVILLGRAFGGSGGIEGEIAMVLSSICYALGNVYVRRNVQGLHPTVPAMFQVGFALVAISVLAVVFESPVRFPSDSRALFAVAWLGVVGSALAYSLYFRIVHVLGATRMSLITYLMPIVAIALGVVVRGEVIEVRSVLGAAVILLGVGLVSRRSPRRGDASLDSARGPALEPAPESAPRPAFGPTLEPALAFDGQEEGARDDDGGRSHAGGHGAPTGGFAETDDSPA